MNKEIKKDKCNDACIKLFEFLKMLYDNDVELKQVVSHFADDKYNGKSNSHVTLNKFLNSLRIFGIKIKKYNSKFKILTHFTTIDFNINDLKCILILKDALKMMPTGKTKQDFEAFIRALEMQFDEKTINIYEALLSNNRFDLEYLNADINEQFNMCERYCNEGQKLEIVYTSSFGREYNIVCSPIEVLFIKKSFCLKAIGNNGSRIYEIPLNNIKSIKQLPISSSKTSVPTTVVFKIKNRLALNYKLRKCEKLEDIDADGNYIIVNKEEDMETLLKRLMKYGTDCELVSPKFLKEEMIQLINKTLSKYQ